MLRLVFFADACDFSPMFAEFADFHRMLQRFVSRFSGLVGRISFLTQNLEKLDPGAVFAPRECLFSDSSRLFLSIRPNIRGCSPNLGRFRPVFVFVEVDFRRKNKTPKCMQVQVFAIYAQGTPM